MQIVLLLALAVALVAVLFALQNVVPVTVSFLAWTFEGSLALVLFVALVAGAVVSFLASLPTLVGRRRAESQARKRIAELEASLSACRLQLEQAQRRPIEPPRGSDPLTQPDSGGQTP
jgi:uncharacterized integral membrane protein